MPVHTTTLAIEPTLVQQHVLSATSSNQRGILYSVTILTYGATVSHLKVPDRNGELQDVVLGFDHWQDYLDQAKPGALNPFFGATIGRTASRIAHATFDLQGTKDAPVEAKTKHSLKVSNGIDCHHGGPLGFDKQHWRTVHVDQDTNTVTFELISPHGQNGYPGRLLTSVAFNLSENGEFTIEYEARLKEKDNYEDPTQRANDLHSTLVSLTNHSYWNLDGVLNTTTTRQQNEDGTEPVLSCDCHIKDHTLWLSSSDLVELGDIHPVPTGRILDQTRQQPSQETAADQLNFTQTGPSGQAARALGPGLDKIPGGYGYDHVYSLVPAGDASLLPSSSRSFPEIQGYYPSTPHVATLYSPRTGIQMELSTSEPALVLYASGYLDSTLLPRTKSKSKSTSVQEETSKTSNALVKAQEINAVFGKFSAICLEPIRFPDAIHHPDWASMVTLHAGEVYRQRTIHKFSTR